MFHEHVELALAALRRGEVVVVADDATRENEGDLIAAAECVTPQTLAFMVRHTSGVICVALPEERLATLQLPLMVADNSESQRTAFTVSVDAKHGISTGISAADRSATTTRSRISSKARRGAVTNGCRCCDRRRPKRSRRAIHP